MVPSPVLPWGSWGEVRDMVRGMRGYLYALGKLQVILLGVVVSEAEKGLDVVHWHGPAVSRRAIVPAEATDAKLPVPSQLDLAL